MTGIAAFRLTAEMIGPDGTVLWRSKTTLEGAVEGAEWATPAGIAQAIANMGNRVADVLREHDQGRETKGQ